MVFLKKNNICSNYTTKPIKLHHFKNFLGGGGMPPSPPSYIQIYKSKKMAPCQILTTPLI